MRKGGSVAHRRYTTRESRSIRNSVIQAEFGCPGEDQARSNLTTNSTVANVFEYGLDAEPTRVKSGRDAAPLTVNDSTEANVVDSSSGIFDMLRLYFIIIIFFVATNDPAVSR